jgi:entericidin B
MQGRARREPDCFPQREGIIMKRLLALLLAASFVLPSAAMLGGCNTVQGAGKDIERGGEKIQQEAQEHKKY